MSNSTVTGYDRQAQGYESKWRNYLAHTHEEFLRRIETDYNDAIIDVSGGTGLLARQFIEGDYPYNNLVINDPSEQMLAIARKRLSNNPNIKFTSYKVEQLPFEANYFDRVFCLNSFHFYTNQRQVLDLFFEILKPGGKLYLLDWNRSGFFRIINWIIQCSSNEYIDTRSLQELRMMIRKSDFNFHDSDTWNWRYWKFLFVEAVKSDA